MISQPGPMGVVITRSREGNRELAKRLRRMGLNPIPVDTISLAPPSDWRDVDRLLGILEDFDWIVFTSPSGVKYFGDRMGALSLRLPWDGGPRVAAVGRQTARALSNLGVKPDFVPSRYTTKILGEELPAEKGARILLLRSDIADPGLGNRFTERGFNVEEAAIYRTLPVRRPSPGIRDAGLIVFASPSAVRSFCALVTEDDLRSLKKLRTVCIGPVTESAARERGFLNTTKPETFTIDAVLSEITRLSRSDA